MSQPTKQLPDTDILGLRFANKTEQTLPPPASSRMLRLVDIALGAVADTCPGSEAEQERQEMRFLSKIAAKIAESGLSSCELVDEVLHKPAVEDSHLVWLANKIHLTKLELLSISVAAAVDYEISIGRVLAYVQAPVGGSRPTLGLLTQALPTFTGPHATVASELMNGQAVNTGVLTILNETAPLPERSLLVPDPLCMALAGHDSKWPGTSIGIDNSAKVPLPETILASAQRHAGALQAEAQRALVLRTSSPAEGRAVTQVIAAALDKRPVFVETDKLAGFGPWILLRNLLPVFCLELAPGERRRFPDLPGYKGPILAVCGPDGSIESAHGAAATWILQTPARSERESLWLSALRPSSDLQLEIRKQDEENIKKSPADLEVLRLSARLAKEYRHGAGRIAHLGRLAHHHAALSGHDRPARDDVIAASWTGEGSGLDGLAGPLKAQVPEKALVTTPVLKASLEAFMLRCRMRDELVSDLGVSARTRYRPGVRALFTGPSGCGKTLAAGWIATSLGLPLYRVDLASVTSKYIGETEKNLSQLLARAEQAEVMLLFDEADSLFGKRTDINEANDRFANAQTNYLLQRIENYDGFVLLTSNSQARFDEAFARRLDFIIEFPLPGPEERRALWEAHLGSNSMLQSVELNKVALLLDLSGGHIRNVVLAAAVLAGNENRKITFVDILAGVEAELRKLGRQMPMELKGAYRPEH